MIIKINVACDCIVTMVIIVMFCCCFSASGQRSPMSPPGGPGDEMDEQALQEKRDADFALMLQECEGPLPIHVRMCGCVGGVRVCGGEDVWGVRMCCEMKMLWSNFSTPLISPPIFPQYSLCLVHSV